MPVSEVYNEDNMIGMARYPDGYFGLAVVDPPFGLGDKLTKGGGKRGMTMGSRFKEKDSYNLKQWDNARPDKEYFTELMRVSKNQIIWGSNYFELPPCRGVIAWDKKQTVPNFSAFELAWTSYDRPASIFRKADHGIFRDGSTIHPTQKPVALYKWLLTNYAKQGDKILDTHLGSQSSRIAAYDLGFDFYGWELDKDYYEAGNKRFEQFKSQLKLFQ